MTETVHRCAWAKGSLMEADHDNEWGRPIRDEQKLYEMLLLKAFQAGLSWYAVWSKRDLFLRAFDGFDAHKIAAYGQDKMDALMKAEGIIRCPAKEKQPLATRVFFRHSAAVRQLFRLSVRLHLKGSACGEPGEAALRYVVSQRRHFCRPAPPWHEVYGLGNGVQLSVGCGRGQRP